MDGRYARESRERGHARRQTEGTWWVKVWLRRCRALAEGTLAA